VLHDILRVAGTDTEATLSAEYGGTGGSNAAVDAVYVALGRVLTISGRTIKDEAQVGEGEWVCSGCVGFLGGDSTGFAGKCSCV
jgi:hypothetical protein